MSSATCLVLLFALVFFVSQLAAAEVKSGYLNATDTNEGAMAEGGQIEWGAVVMYEGKSTTDLIKMLQTSERAKEIAERAKDQAEMIAEMQRCRADEAHKILETQNTRRKNCLRKCNSFSEILVDAEILANKLPVHAYVPHIRDVIEYPDPSGIQAPDQWKYATISDPATDDELEKADAALQMCRPKIRVGKYGEDELLDDLDIAYQDRGNSGDIIFSDQTLWGLERLTSRAEAVLVTAVIIGHERAHILSYKYRYKGKQLTFEKFRSYTSKEKAGSEVCRARP